jgi:FdhD protein
VYLVQGEQTVDAIAEEVPIAFVYNGVSHVVMMATPQDFHDFAVGFSLTEGIVNSVADIYSVETQKDDNGVLLQIEISSECFAKLKEKRRNLTGRTGCGLCGADSLESAIRWPEQVNNTTTVRHEVLEKTFSELTAKQPLHLKTGATHAAAWADVTGHIKLVREDVGRHNALDKLIGAMSTAKESNDGFVALSSRISYEMVQKAAVMGIEIVAAVSAPTGLAIELAQKTNVTLVRCNKQRGINIYTYPARIK